MSQAAWSRSRLPMTLVGLAAAVVVIAGLRAAQALVVPFMLALFLAIIAAPGVSWLRRRGVPVAVAVLVVVLVMLAVLSAVGVLLGGSVNRFLAAIPQFQERIDGLVGSLSELLERFDFETAPGELEEVISPGSFMSWIGGGLKALAAILSNIFMIMLIVVFMLLEGVWLPVKLRVAFGSDSDAVHRMDEAARQIQRYLAVKTVISLTTGCLVAIWTAIIGLDFALVWGLLAFLLNFIPTIGSLVAAVPAVLFALVQLGLGPALAVAAGYLVVNTVFGNIVEPNVMGRTLGLSALVIFLSLAFWGWVLGTLGMLLSVPLTMIVKIILEANETTRSIALLLDSGRAAAARLQQEEAEVKAS